MIRTASAHLWRAFLRRHRRPQRWMRSMAWLVAALAVAPAWAQPIVVRDDRGNVHRFDTLPQRIVSLLPSLTETAWVLGGGAKLVGVDRYSSGRPEVAALPRLGGLDDPQIEAIARLKPDLILASTAARSLDKLEALGFVVVRLKSESHADVRRTLGLVARLLGTPQAAEGVWARVEDDIAAAARPMI